MLDDGDVGDEIGRETGNVMGISTPAQQQYRDKTTSSSSLINPMSQGGFFSFPPPPNAFDRTSHEQDKIRFHNFESAAAYPAVYDSAGMLSEMFDYGGSRSSAPAELLGLVDQQNPQISGMHAGDSAAAAMHLFLTNPPPPRSPPPQQPHNSTAHALIPDQGFHAPQFTWIPEVSAAAAGAGVAVEGQRLSLSLASSLEAAKAEELMFFNAAQEGRAAAAQGAPSSSQYSYQQLHFGFGTTSSSVFSLAAVNVLRNSKYTRPAQELLEEFCSVGRGHFKKSTKNTNTKFAAGNTNPTASTSRSGGGPTTENLPPLSPADKMEHQRRKVKLASMLDEVERRYSHYCEQMQMVVSSFDMVMGFGAAVPYTTLAQKAMSRHFRCLKDGIQAQLKQSCELLGEKDMMGGTGITKGETPRLKMLEQSLRKQRAFHQMGMMEQEAWRPNRGLPERSVNGLRAWLFEHFLHPYPSDADKHLLARQTGLSRNQVANWFINARVRLWKPMIEEMYQEESKEREELAGEENNGEGEEDEEEEEHRESNTNAQTPTTTTPATGAITSQINESDPSVLFNNIASASLMANYIRQQQQPPQLPPAAANAVGPTTNAHQGFIQTTSTATTTSYSHVDARNHFGTTATGGVGDSRGGAHHHYHDNSSAGVGPTMIRFGTTTNAAGPGDISLTLGLHQGGGAGSRNPPEKTGFSFRDFGRST